MEAQCRASPSSTGVGDSIPGQGGKIPHALWPKTKTENRNNIATNSVKTLKMICIQNKQKKILNKTPKIAYKVIRKYKVLKSHV